MNLHNCEFVVCYSKEERICEMKNRFLLSLMLTAALALTACGTDNDTIASNDSSEIIISAEMEESSEMEDSSEADLLMDKENERLDERAKEIINQWIAQQEQGQKPSTGDGNSNLGSNVF